MSSRLLIIDDEKNIRRTLHMILRAEKYTVRVAENGEDGLAVLEEYPADLVLLDVNLPGRDGIEILEDLKQRRPETAVIMISGEATVSTAVEATRLGAYDFLEKPLSKDRVLIAVRNALRDGAQRETVTRVVDTERRRQQLVGESESLDRLRGQIERVGPTHATVLITGESGTGKELVARAVHEASPRAGGPFVKVNCAAIPQDLIETELFGCVKGAYTGADRSRDGKFLLADGGTLFLDEIGDMSLKAQAKVLRALQEGEIERVGAETTLTVDVRVVAATNKNLQEETAAGRFREDLFYRLNVVPLVTPPLRERSGDIPELCRHFLELYAFENDLPVRRLGSDALKALAARRWVGNIRELRNVLERLVILSDSDPMSADDVRVLAPADPAAPGTAGRGSLTALSAQAIREAGGLGALRRELERACITTCLEDAGGNVSEAARMLGVERTNLYKKMQALDLEVDRGRDGEEGGS